MSQGIDRRKFLQYVGVGAGTAGLAAMGRPTFAQDHGDGHTETAEGQPEWAAMDAHHQEGVQYFLDHMADDPTFWGRPLEYTEDNGVKVFNLTCSEIDWEVTPESIIPAMAYNGIVPGPEIRVTEGDTVRINVTNEMNQSTAVHWHGLYVPNSMDGVPFITQPPIAPGETFTYEFLIRNSGTHMYHSHHNAAEQTTRGLLGAFIVEPADKSREPEFTQDFTMILNDTALGYTINGKGFPHTQAMFARLGEKIRIRYMNEGLMIHPMHLHGMAQLVVAKDGFNLPSPYYCDTLNIAPGERYDVIVDCTELGAWAFHCHILTHAEARTGMFGMVTALVVSE